MGKMMVVQRGTLGSQLRKLRTDRGWTLKQVAELTGMELSTLSNWETDNHAPNVNKLCDLLKVYGRKVFIGLEGEDDDDAANGGM